MQDGKSYDTAFELEEGVSREISIGAGEEVFLRFAALERNQRYTVKSTGDADTYGELYDGSSSPLTSADGAARAKLFHHVHQIFKDLLSGRKTDGQDGLPPPSVSSILLHKRQYVPLLF